MNTLILAEEASPVRARLAVDDGQLLKRMSTGDKAAFEQLYDRHVRSVHAYALTHLQSRDDAEEVTQDVFVTLWEKRAQIVLAGNSAVPWLIVTCKNKMANRNRALQVRDRRHGRSLVDEQTASTHSGPDQIFQLTQLREALQTAIDSLGDTDRAVFDACLVDGRSYAEAAAHIGLTSNIVRNRLARIRIRLRGELNTLKGTS